MREELMRDKMRRLVPVMRRDLQREGGISLDEPHYETEHTAVFRAWLGDVSLGVFVITDRGGDSIGQQSAQMVKTYRKAAAPHKRLYRFAKGFSICNGFSTHPVQMFRRKDGACIVR